MFYITVLLCCLAQCYVVQHCVVLLGTMLSTAWQSTVLHNTALSCTAQLYVVWHSGVAWHSAVVWHCAMLHSAQCCVTQHSLT